MALAETDNIAALQAFEISPKAMARYGDLSVIAITARVVAKARR